MELIQIIVLLSAMVEAVLGGECVDSRCFTTNSSHTADGVIVNHGCAHTGPSLYQCSLSIMVMSDTTGNKAGCVALGNVPGMQQFCTNHVMGLAAPPSIIEKAKCPDSRTDSPVDEKVDLRNEYITCIETEVVVGVAVGSFVLGCFVTWAIITVLTQCRRLRKDLRDAQHPNSIRSIGYPRTGFEMSTSSAHQRLLSNGSADSYQPGSMSHASRRQSDESRIERSGSGRAFQMRQPLPALPIHEVSLQPYYAQPIDSLYTCTSDKDYQSIQGGSEHYAPLGQGGDYTSLKSNTVTVVRPTDKSKQSPEKDTVNDYCSLESERGSTDETAIYSAASEGSNRDYSSLMDDGEAEINHREQPATDANRMNNNVKFQVNGLGGFNATNSEADQANLHSNHAYKTIDKKSEPNKSQKNISVDAEKVHHSGTQSASTADNAYAGVDFHDYETCNGSVHEYFVLEAENSKHN